MARVPLYSEAPRKSLLPEDSAASKPAKPAEPTGDPVARRSLIRFLRRHDRILLAAVAVAALGAALISALIPRAPMTPDSEALEASVLEIIGNLPDPPSIASQAYAVIGPSVVRVGRFSEDDESSEAGVGTGVVIDEAGIILTALHVVTGPERIVVTFIDGFETGAEIVMAQPENDIAALQVEVIPEGLIPATLTSTRDLRPGDDVVAVGHPFGIGHSVSAGVVSGLERTYLSEEEETPFSGLIQFDAAANPGNSGGPLVNRYGEVLGIVSSILNPTDDGVFIGIGFAVPIETAARAGGPNPF